MNEIYIYSLFSAKQLLNIICLPMICFQRHDERITEPELQRVTKMKFFLIKLIGTLRSNDADGKKNVKKKNRYNEQTTILRVYHAFLYISLSVFARLRRENAYNFAFYGVRKQATTKFRFSFYTWIWSLGIQLQEGSPTFDKVSG